MKRYKGLGRVFSFTLTQQLRQRGWRTATIAVALACLLILLASVSGLVMWWRRRPQGRFGVPPLRHDLPLWKGGVAIMFGLGLLFPLVGASLLLMLVLDWLGQRLTRRGAEAVAG